MSGRRPPPARARKAKGVLRRPTFWISMVSMLGVFFFVVGDLGRTAPGPLARAHENVSALTGFRSCTHCHGGWFSDMAAACIECHEVIGAQIEGGKGLHGSFGADKGRDCARCHSEHHGSEFQMVNEQSFRQAGFASRKEFDHKAVGFDLWGRHLELDCATCHEHADAELVPEGARRFIGLDQDCRKCHEDAHGGLMQVGCASCHGQEAFKELFAKGHERFLPLTGTHGQKTCRDCHGKDATHSLEVVGGANPPPPRQCATCHESPHSERFARAVAEVVGEQQPASCGTCHDSTHASFRKEDLEITAEQHAASGFALAVPHDKQKCADCHDPAVPEFGKRYPGREPDTCQSCHGDPHGGQFANSAFGANGCLGCHERVRFAPHGFDVEKHARTRLPLTGTHLEQKCEACHEKQAEDRPRLFHGTSPRCVACHDDAHDGFFDRTLAAPGARPAGETSPRTGSERDPESGGLAARPWNEDRKNLGGNRWGLPVKPAQPTPAPKVARRPVVAPEPLPPGGVECSECHAPTKFREVKAFDHGKWTGFPIRGAHAQETCERCHGRADEPDTKRRTFGRVRVRYGPMRGCVTCHEDPHRGQFDKPGLPDKVNGRGTCARCHSDNSFRSLTADFDHGAWTGFPLKAAHGRASCDACHPPTRDARPGGRALGRAKGQRCAECHESPHGEQFDGRACASCHKPADSFATLVFDHDIHSRFKLGDRHRAVACARCHKEETQGALTFVRYRPLASECADCHSAQNNPLRRRQGGR